MALIPALVAPPSPIWFFARGAGFVSLLLLTLSVCLGILLSMRARSRSWPLFLSDSLHGYTALVFFVFVALHVVTVLIDPFTKFGLVDVLVPFATAYRRVWMGLGILSLELALALGVSIYVRPWVGYRAWRLMHYGTYVILPMALVHGLATGTDTNTSWGIAVYGVCLIAVVVVFALRLSQSVTPLRLPAGAAVALGLVALVAWVASGPLRPGWARAAGTPEQLGSTVLASPAPSPSGVALARPFIDQISGTITAQPEAGEAGSFRASGRGTGSVDLRWSAYLQDASSTVGGTITITLADGTPVCTGAVVASGSHGIEAMCTPAGAQGSLDIVLLLRQRADGFLSGSLSVKTGPGST